MLIMETFASLPLRSPKWSWWRRPSGGPTSKPQEDEEDECSHIVTKVQQGIIIMITNLASGRNECPAL